MQDDLFNESELDEQYILSEKERKPSFLSRIVGFFTKLFVKKKEETEQVDFSRFSSFLYGLTEGTDVYAQIEETVILCDNALRTARQRVTLAKKIKVIDDTLAELECFNRLTEDETKKLKNMLESFVALTKERNVLLYQLTSFDRALGYMVDLVDDAENAMPQILNAEKNQRIFRQDIGQLEGEKTDLEYEREALEKGISFLSKFSLGCIAAFGLSAVYLGYTFILDKGSIFIPTTVIVLLTIAVATLIYVFRKRMVFELTMNIRKQRRLVEMLNKKSVVYAYYTNYLRFVYKKYKVTNSSMLRTTINDFEHYKHITSRIDSIRSILYETEARIEAFLKQKKIVNVKTTLEQFAKTINVEDKREYYNELIEKKAAFEAELLALDQTNAELFEKIEENNKNDISEEKLVNTMIKVYFDEVSRLMQTIDSSDELEFLEEDDEVQNGNSSIA